MQQTAIIAMIDQHKDWLNYKAGQYFYYMKKRNWIQSYPTVDGIDQILKSMSRRTPYDNTMHRAVVELEIHYEELEQGFIDFFKIINAHAKAFVGSK